MDSTLVAATRSIMAGVILLLRAGLKECDELVHVFVGESLLEKPGMVLGPDLTFCEILLALASVRFLPTAPPAPLLPWQAAHPYRKNSSPPSCTESPVCASAGFASGIPSNRYVSPRYATFVRV